MKISRKKIPHSTKKKLLSNDSSKTELISKFAEELCNARILTVRCRDDADTDIVKQCLEHFLKGTVEVRAECSDISIMLTHHCHPHKQHLITDTTLNGNYCVKETFLSLAIELRQYLIFCHSFTGCNRVSSQYGISKKALFERHCVKYVSALIDVFHDDKPTKEQIVNAGIEIVQFIYKS